MLCNHELASRLDLGLPSLSLAALAAHWTIPQAHPHDALDDARALATTLPRAVARASDLGVALPIRHPATLPPIKFPTAA